jgi:hypothetical protein
MARMTPTWTAAIGVIRATVASLTCVLVVENAKTPRHKDNVKLNSIVIVNLQAPRERFFGRLFDIATYGVTVRGIDLNAFGDWMDHITHREESGVQPTTVFFPIHRIEKIILDEGIGALPSFSDTFLTKVGSAVEDHLEQ